jgi:putative membrane protein insertion efficiency factor
MVDPSLIGGKRKRFQNNNSGGDDHTWDGCFDGCDLPGCDGCDLPCDLLMGLRLLGALAIRTPSRAPRRRTSGPAAMGVVAIRAYQKMISPRLPTVCRHTPTCSSYGIDAVRRYGLATGTRLTAGRISRCNRSVPRGTVDLVP